MTDQELIKAVAEVLGIEFVTYDNKLCFYKKNGDFDYSFNPLANTPEAKEFCFDLMIENRISPFVHDGYTSVTNYSHNMTLARDKNPQRAVLLAFIELNKEKQNAPD